MRKAFAALAIAGLSVGVAACGSDDESDDTAAPAASTPDGATTCIQSGEDDGMDAYVGLDEAAAQALAEESGMTLRVVGVDGECSIVTMDLRDDRVNVEIADGVVIAAAIY